MTANIEPLTSILVDVDATASSHGALERAIPLAQASGATLTIADVLAVPPYPPREGSETTEAELAIRRERLALIAPGLHTESLALAGQPATALIQEVLRSNHGLLVRSQARDVAAANVPPFGPVNLELLRKCPCPVLLVRHGRPAERPRIAGAVNAGTSDEAERALNVRIAEWTLRMAELTGGSALLLQAWSPVAERVIRGQSSGDAVADYADDIRRRAESDLRQFVQSFGDRLAAVQAVHRRGEPTDVIPEFVVAEGIDVIVMGTVARGGLAGLVIGNTAERVLRKLPCSVLAVKPDGFVSPVKLDAV